MCNAVFFTVDTMLIGHLVTLYGNKEWFALLILSFLSCNLIVHDNWQMPCRMTSRAPQPSVSNQMCMLHIQRSMHQLTLVPMVLTHLACYNCRNMVESFRFYRTVCKVLYLNVQMIKTSYKTSLKEKGLASILICSFPAWQTTI
jgi:hypothetical protein